MIIIILKYGIILINNHYSENLTRFEGIERGSVDRSSSYTFKKFNSFFCLLLLMNTDKMAICFVERISRIEKISSSMMEFPYHSFS